MKYTKKLIILMLITLTQCAWPSSLALLGMMGGESSGGILPLIPGSSTTTTPTPEPGDTVVLQITPDSPEIPSGASLQSTALLVSSNGTITDVTTSAQWSSASSSVATVDNVTNKGQVTAVITGSATIAATSAGTTGNADVTVTNASLSRIEVSPTSASMTYVTAPATATTKQLKATAVFSDGSEIDITNVATWSVTGSSATISTAGLVTSLNSASSTTVQASYTVGSTKTADSEITVGTCTVSSVTISPNTATSIAFGSNLQFSAIAAYSGGCSSQDVSTIVSWSSDTIATATVNSSGLLTSVDSGTTNVTASFGGQSSVATAVTVKSKSVTLSSIAVTPSSETLEYPKQKQYTATATYSDASTQDVTTQAAWISSNTSSATISNISGSNGMLSTKKVAGSSTLSASFGGITVTTSLTVTADTTPPYMLTAVSDTSTTVIVTYSENMRQDLDGVATWDTGAADDPTTYELLVEDDSLNGGCTNGASVINPTSVTKIDGKTYKLVFGITVCSDDLFRITNTTVQDKVENTITDPNFLTFKGLEQFKVISAESKGLNSLEVVFNRELDTSAACADASACATKYKISDVLLVVQSATVSGNKVNLTHTTDQSGIAYTVMVANGLSSTAADGFTNTAGEYLYSIGDTGDNVQASPNDRASFVGAGEAFDKFEDGFYFSDPFVDGTIFSFAFDYANKVYLGTNDTNSSAFRFEPTGDNAILVDFDWDSTVSSAQCYSYGVKGFGFLNSDYFDGTLSSVHNINENIGGATSNCTAHADYQHIGVDVELGVVGFTSGKPVISSTNYEMLFVGTLKKAAAHVYYTQDLDATLDFKRYAVTGTNGVNSKSIQNIYTYNNYVYTGLSSNHGTNAPVLNRHVLTQSSGVITVGAGENYTANSIANIGKGGTPANANAAGVVGIDAMIVFNGVMYIANNAGVSYSSNFTAATIGNVTWTTGTPSSGSWAGTTLWMPEANLAARGGGLGKVSPGVKGIPQFMEYGGRLYMARNVTSGTDTAQDADGIANNDPGHGELWVCNPASSGNSSICEAADWTRLIAGNEAGLPSTNSISLLKANGTNTFYIGFDDYSYGATYASGSAGGVDGTDGIRLYRLNTGVTPTSLSSFTQQGPATLGLPGVGNAKNRMIFSSASVTDGSKKIIYINVGDGDRAIQVFRQIDN